MKQSKLANIFKALSNEQRLQLFKMIYKASKKKGGYKTKSSKACCAPIEKAFTTACDCMNISRSTISHHFKELQNAGLITCTRNGQSYICEVNEKNLDLVRNFLE